MHTCVDDAVEGEEVENVVFHARLVSLDVDGFLDLVSRRFASRELVLASSSVSFQLEEG